MEIRPSSVRLEVEREIHDVSLDPRSGHPESASRRQVAGSARASLRAMTTTGQAISLDLTREEHAHIQSEGPEAALDLLAEAPDDRIMLG